MDLRFGLVAQAGNVSVSKIKSAMARLGSDDDENWFVLICIYMYLSTWSGA